MHIKFSATIITILFLLSGCATSTVSYAPPSESNIQNSKQVNQPFDALWDQLIKKLSSDFFVINNIDKNSRLINLGALKNQVQYLRKIMLHGKNLHAVKY